MSFLGDSVLGNNLQPASKDADRANSAYPSIFEIQNTTIPIQVRQRILSKTKQ